jgi:protocatechuate 3,4-dioxygenase beta subunit
MTDTRIARRTFAVGGAASVGLGALAACSSDDGDATESASPSTSASPTEAATGADTTCVLTSEVTEGPYYLDDALERTDITEGKTGAPLALQITVVDADGCTPLANAMVEIWHCDAWGYYSGFTTANPGGSAPAEDGTGDDETFLRGFQITDDAGQVAFTTIVPGWYTPRATHIHVKVHTGGTVDDAEYEDGAVIHTGQFFFDDDTVLALDEVEPYSEHTGDHTLLDDDMVYTGGGVQDGLLTLTANDDTDPSAGYAATITVGVTP